jgi:hypothetical protein
MNERKEEGRKLGPISFLTVHSNCNTYRPNQIHSLRRKIDRFYV